MSDDEFTKEDWQKLNDSAFVKTDSILESAEHPFFAKKTLFTSILTNLGLFFVWLFLPTIFRWLFPNEPKALYDEFYILIVFLIIGIFACGFFIGYSATKLFRMNSSKQNDLQINSGFMSGYSSVDQRNRNYKIWFISAAAGVCNTLIIFVLTSIIRENVLQKIMRMI